MLAPAPHARYSGQITDKGMLGDDSEDEGEDWFAGKLKFKRHIDDTFRVGGDGRDVDDYVTIDSRVEAATGSKRARTHVERSGAAGGGGHRPREDGHRRGGRDDYRRAAPGDRHSRGRSSDRYRHYGRDDRRNR